MAGGDQLAAQRQHRLAPPHSITSSARMSSVGGMVIPSASAPLKDRKDWKD